MSKLPGIKGACLNCRYCKIVDGVATCNGNNHYTATGRLVLEIPLADGFHSLLRSDKRTYLAARQLEVLKQLRNKVNPSWCPFREEGLLGDKFRESHKCDYKEIAHE